MKRQIRRNVFETNSSSMHSLVVLKEDTELPVKEDYSACVCGDGYFHIWSDYNLEFDRTPFRCLCDVYSKTRYAIASICGFSDTAQKDFAEIEKIFMEIVPECKGIKLPKLDWNDKEPYYGYTDDNILMSFLEKNNITLKEFLSNDRYIVIVDGDEYCIYRTMKESGIINTDAIEMEYPDRNCDYEEDF